MLRGQGFTLFEIIVVLIIIGIAVAFTLPNFNTPTEQARASTAQNNLLAIYSAEQNFRNNNNGNYYVSSSSNDIAGINSALSLNILDDGSYLYDCGVTTTNACTATRNLSPTPLSISVALNQPIQLNNEVNPSCSGSSSSQWCP